MCCCCSVEKTCLTLCDLMIGGMAGFPVLHYLPHCCKNYQTVTKKNKVSKCCWKDGSNRFTWRGLPQTFNL